MYLHFDLLEDNYIDEPRHQSPHACNYANTGSHLTQKFVRKENYLSPKHKKDYGDHLHFTCY